MGYLQQIHDVVTLCTDYRVEGVYVAENLSECSV